MRGFGSTIRAGTIPLRPGVKTTAHSSPTASPHTSSPLRDLSKRSGPISSRHCHHLVSLELKIFFSLFPRMIEQTPGLLCVH